MGIQSFTRCFHQSVALEWVHLLHILHELKKERESCDDDDGADDQNTSTGVSNTFTVPIIDIDANNVAFRLPGKSAESLLDLNQKLVREGLKVNVMTDNRSERHSSKRVLYAKFHTLH